jgi:glycosyltransferase involved in cell wall biosynthesis
VADGVVFISAHARDEALAEDLVDPGRTAIIHNGVDHSVAQMAGTQVRPGGTARLPEDAETILCLGTDFRHKNRMFALRLIAELRERHDWAGYLVLAGPHVTLGSSAPEEAALMATHPGLAAGVIELGAVTEAEKAWLFERSRLVVYPTVHEGFGLLPFEAADHDRPCLWAPATSLAEVLPPKAGEIVPWDVRLSAERAMSLLRDEAARRRNIEAVHEAAAGLTWDRAARELLRVYRETCDAPAAPASAIERRHGIMQGLLSEDAMRLVGPDGALAPELERPLLALATHPQISAPMFGAVKLGYRAGYAWRRRLKRSAR